MHAKVEPTRMKKHTSPLQEHQPPRLVNITPHDVTNEDATNTDESTAQASNARRAQQRRGQLALTAVATLIVLALGAALFVLPIKSWLNQRDQLATRTEELTTLDAANDQLQTEVDRLQTEDGVKQAAREVIDYVEKGEQRITVMPVGLAPTTLPAGWPYDIVTTIIAIRQAEAAPLAATTGP